MITNPKVGDKYWIIFFQQNGHTNCGSIVIARATILHINDSLISKYGPLGPVCVCAVISDNHVACVSLSPQLVCAHQMYNTWDEAINSLEYTITGGISDLRRYREQVTEEVRKKLQELPDGYKEEDLEGTVEEFFADQCSMITIQESPRKEDKQINTNTPE